MQGNFHRINKQIVTTAIFHVVESFVVNYLANDLLHPTSDTIKGPVVSALEGQTPVWAVACVPFWQRPVDQSAQLVLRVLGEHMRAPVVRGITHNPLTFEEGQPATKICTVENLGIVHDPRMGERSKDDFAF
jgi:hypothetical protein